MGDAMAKVAKSFPQTNFAIIDFPSAALKGKPKNVHGLLFKENEAGYPVGPWPGSTRRRRAASRSCRPSAARRCRLSTRTPRAMRPAPRRPTRGSRCSSLRAGSSIRAKCKEIALNQIGQGFAGRLRDRGPVRPRRARRGQAEERPGHRRRRRPGLRQAGLMDVGAQEGRRRGVRHRQDVQDGKFKGGMDTIFDVKSGGVGLAPTPPPAAAVRGRRQEGPGADRRVARSPTSPRSRDILVGRVLASELSARHALGLEGGTTSASRVVANDYVDFDLRKGEVDARSARTARATRCHEPLLGSTGRTRARCASSEPCRVARSRRSSRGRHGGRALHARPGDDGGREHRPRRRASVARCLLLYMTAAARRVRELRRRPRRASVDPSAGGQITGSAQRAAGRDPAPLIAAPTRDPRRADRALSAQETQELFGICDADRGGQVDRLFISHKLGEVLDIADRVSVLLSAARGRDGLDGRATRSRCAHDGRARRAVPCRQGAG